MQNNEKLERVEESAAPPKPRTENEDEKFAADFVDVFGGFPQDQAIAMLVRRQREIRGEVGNAG